MGCLTLQRASSAPWLALPLARAKLLLAEPSFVGETSFVNASCPPSERASERHHNFIGNTAATHVAVGGEPSNQHANAKEGARRVALAQLVGRSVGLLCVFRRAKFPADLGRAEGPSLPSFLAGWAAAPPAI